MGITRLRRGFTRLHRGITIIQSSAARHRRRRIVDPIHAALEKGLGDNHYHYHYHYHFCYYYIVFIIFVIIIFVIIIVVIINFVIIIFVVIIIITAIIIIVRGEFLFLSVWHSDTLNSSIGVFLCFLRNVSTVLFTFLLLIFLGCRYYYISFEGAHSFLSACTFLAPCSLLSLSFLFLSLSIFFIGGFGMLVQVKHSRLSF